MKSLLSLLFSLSVALTLVGQNGVYLYGFMENAPAESVPVDVFMYSDSNMMATTLFTQPSGDIPTQWVDLPAGFEILWLSAGFIDCDSTYLQQNWGANELDNLIDIPVFLNYCQDTLIYGCTDPTALNYNPNALVNDGSCQYATECDLNDIYVTINTNNWASELSWNLITDNISVASGGNYQNYASAVSYHCVPDGCYILELHDSWGDGWNGSTFKVVHNGNIIASGTLAQGSFSTVTFGINQTGCAETIYGCTDSLSTNYNPLATNDDGTCTYPLANDICEDALPILPGITIVDNTEAVINTGIWGECWGFGQGEGEQSSVWYSFTTPDFPAGISFEALYDGSNTLTDTQFGIFEECGGDMIYCDGNGGQGLMSALSFECGELAQNTTYILMIDGWNGNAGTCLLEYAVDSCASPIAGCTDPGSYNYNPIATIDDGSCEYNCSLNSIQVVINTGSWAYEIGWSIVHSDSIVAEGNNNSYGNNSAYTSVYCLPDGCYTFEMYDAFSDGWNGSNFQVIANGDVLASGTLSSGSFGVVNFGINDASCVYTPPIFGCTDPEALNYNPNAIINDGSCQYEIECDLNAVQMVLTTESWAYEISWQLLNADSISVASGSGYENNMESMSQWCLADGCYTFEMFDSYGDGWNGSSFEIFSDSSSIASGTLTNGNYGTVTFGIHQDGCVYTPPIYGCTDPEALNYNPNATVSDGSCEYEIECDENTVQMVVSTQNWDSELSWSVVDSDSNVVASGSGYDSNTTYLSQWCLADGCYTLIHNSTLFGIYEASFEMISNGVVLESGVFASGNAYYSHFGINQEDCEPQTPIYGCTNPWAINYNPNATVNDGSCIYETECTEVFIQLDGNTDPQAQWVLTSDYGYVNSDSLVGAGLYLVECLEDGCYTISLASNDTVNDAVYTVFVNNQIIASGSFNNFQYGTFSIGGGCDSTSAVYGCTDPEAMNYNAAATVDDGSCVYQFSCSIDFLVIPDSTGENIIWILPSGNLLQSIDVLWDFGDGTTSSELFPQHEYIGDGPFLLCVTASFESPNGSTCSVTYCTMLSGDMVGGSGFVATETGFSINVINDQAVVGIEEPNKFSNLTLWPNPSSDQLNITYYTSINASQTLSIMDITGKTLMQDQFGNSVGEFTKAIDVSMLPSGVYILRVTAQDHVEAKRFVIAK